MLFCSQQVKNDKALSSQGDQARTFPRKGGAAQGKASRFTKG